MNKKQKIYYLKTLEPPRDILSAIKKTYDIQLKSEDELQSAPKAGCRAAIIYLRSAFEIGQAKKTLKESGSCFFTVMAEREPFEQCVLLQAFENVTSVLPSDIDTKPMLECILKCVKSAESKTNEEYLKQKAEKQKHNALMGEMLSSISHQMRQPINAISAEMVRLKIGSFMGEADSQFIHGVLDNVSAQVEKMSKTITEFLNYFNPARCKTTFFLQELGEELLFLYKEQLNRQNVKLSLDIPKDLRIYGSKTSLTEVLANFVSNSLDAFAQSGRQSGQIDISATNSDSFILLIVKDDGEGIKPEFADKILTEYFTTKPKEKGAGLGLSICKRIIESEFAGSIAAKNVDDGFCVEVNIPKINKN